jgi:class 3 adenylate cyclase
MALRISVTGEKFLLQLFPFFPFDIHIKIEYLSIYMGLPTFSFFLFFAFNKDSKYLYQNNKKNLYYIFNEEFYYPIIQFIFYFSLPFIIITTITKTSFYGDFLKLYQLFIIIACIYLFYGMILATIKKKEGAFFSLIGIIVPFLTIINDILSAKRIVQTGYLLPYGIFVFILFQSLSLAYKFSLSFTYSEKLTKHLKELIIIFEKFIPKEFLELLNKRDITSIKLGDQIQKEMTIMFSDIRSFTSFSEKLSPQENFNFINEYLSFTEPIIRKRNGFIDKYLGDGFMALFPSSTEDALQSAIEIQTSIKDFNKFINEMGYESIKIGIGIHSGNLILGVVGSSSRIETTVISDVVNTASRLEKLNKDFGTDIIITDSIINSVKDKSLYKYRYIGTILLRGKTSPVKIYEIYNHYPDFLKEQYEITKEKFYEGITLFTKNKIENALEIFDHIIEKNPYDNPARYYQFKCRSIIGF